MTSIDEKILNEGVVLFRSVYKKEITEEIFAHKHFANPDCLEIPFIIEHQNEKPVAMRWMMRNEFQLGSRKLSAVQSSDDAVLEEARGLLFLKIRKKSAAVMQENHIDFEYGCFNKGPAMDIAEKTGEKNIVNLVMARLFLYEKTHKWKRFNLPIPGVVSQIIGTHRKKRLLNKSDSSINIVSTAECPFNEEDYQQINYGEGLMITRTQAYYAWKNGEKNNILYITARTVDDKLAGFIIVEDRGESAVLADWDVFSPETSGVMSGLLYSAVQHYQYIDIPALNSERGEMKLFTELGAKDMSRLWAPICICAKAVSVDCEDIINCASNWKYRLIDADYYLNT